MKKSYDSKFKSRVALEALRGELRLSPRLDNILLKDWSAPLP